VPRTLNIRQHLRSCCPELLGYLDGEQRALQRELSPYDAISDEEVQEGAARAIEAMTDKTFRTVLRLRFGMDRGWERRTPQEVGELLGGRYARNGGLVNRLIKRARQAIPLVADDPSGLAILYEDEDLLVVSKPPSLRTTPVHRFVGKSLVSQLIGYLRPTNGSSPPFLVHRLDQGTSGVFVCAKHREAAHRVMSQWHAPACRKEYLAVVRRTPRADSLGQLEAIVGASTTVRAAIGPDLEAPPGSSRQCVVADDDALGKPAATRFKVQAVSGSAALLRCLLLEHGRTHQVRVHAAHVGFPLVGDDYYGEEPAAAGGEPPLIARSALHAWRLKLLHPRTGKPLALQAPPPGDMRSCAKALGLMGGGRG